MQTTPFLIGVTKKEHTKLMNLAGTDQTVQPQSSENSHEVSVSHLVLENRTCSAFLDQ